MPKSDVTRTRACAGIGVELAGVDFAASDEATFELLRESLHEDLVLFVRDQYLDPSELRDLAARFGELDVNTLAPREPGFEDVVRIEYDGNAPDIWHYDASFTATPPAVGMLSMLECPAVGGDTMWLNCRLAYEILSPPIRALVDGLTVACDGSWIGRPDLYAEHPLVRVHPVTGRPSLFLDFFYGRRILELSASESSALLALLGAFVGDPRLAVRWHWRPGDLVLWDNQATLHRVVPDWEGARVAHRVSVRGDTPVGPRDTAWPRYVPGRSATGRFDADTLRMAQSA